MTVIRICAVVLLLGSNFVFSQSEDRTGRFVAVDKFSSFWGYNPPVQRLVFLADSEIKGSELLKIVYMPPTRRTLESTRYLDSKTLSFENEWRLSLRRADKREESFCRFPNFLGEFTGNREPLGTATSPPLAHFQSTQFEADMLFDFSKIECFILESMKEH